MSYGLTMSTIGQCRKWWNCLVPIFESKRHTKDVEESYTELLNLILKGNHQIKDNLDIDSKEKVETSGADAFFRKNSAAYKQSPFYIEFEEIVKQHRYRLTQLDQQINNTKIVKNPFYMANLIEEMNIKFGSCLPIWTNLIGKYVKGNEKSTVSNAPAENWFKLLSVNKLLKERNLRISRFVRLRQDLIQGYLKKILVMPVFQTKFTSQKSIVKDMKKRKNAKRETNEMKNNENEDAGILDDESNVEEQWSKTKPSTTTYQGYKFLKGNSTVLQKSPPVLQSSKRNKLEFYKNGTVVNKGYYNFKQNERTILVGDLKHITSKYFKRYRILTEVTLSELCEFDGENWLTTSSLEWMSTILSKNNKIKRDIKIHQTKATSL